MTFVSLRLWMIATRQRREAVTDSCYLRNRSLCAGPPGESPACRYEAASRRYYDCQPPAGKREFAGRDNGPETAPEIRLIDYRDPSVRTNPREIGPIREGAGNLRSIATRLDLDARAARV